MREKYYSVVIQFLKFSVVGLTNTLISYFLNIIVLLVFKRYNLKWDYVAGNIAAFFLGVLWSFYWNNKFVFVTKDGQKQNLGKLLLKTYISYGLTGIVLNNILSYIWIELLDISKYVAPLINLAVSTPLNFFINKLWAFK